MSCLISKLHYYSYPEHESVFNIKENLLLLSVVSDKRVQGVSVRYPANQSRVGRQWNHRKPLNPANVYHILSNEILRIQCIAWLNQVKKGHN